jgi:hypothetical protein
MGIDIKKIIYFIALILTTIVATYYLSKVIGSIWLIAVLILYWYSDDEPFWLVFFWVLSDGFMSFFGSYSATLSPFPGLPDIEILQFYIILSILKARKKKRDYNLFFKPILNVMGFYLLILMLEGFVIGIGGQINIFFRIIKLTVPFLLFYSVPKLIKKREDYMEIFAYVFFVAILAFGAQIFVIIMRQPISSYLGAKEGIIIDIIEDVPTRVGYNPSVVLLALFGSIYCSLRNEIRFRQAYLNVITIAMMLMAFLAASRGWSIAFAFTIITSMFFTGWLRKRRIISAFGIGILLIFLLMQVPRLNVQIKSAFKRISTVEKIAEGDITAGGTQGRTTIRGPIVMKKWEQRPILGLGFSKEYFDSYDSHVGNQSALLHSGIIGCLLLLIYFIQFNFKMFNSARKSINKSHIIFVFFFIGWFFIHSTSVQQFGYLLMPGAALTQIVFFCFGAFCYAESEGNILLSNNE